MTRSRFVFLSFLSIAISLAGSVFQSPQLACAETFYVGLDGNDENPGTKALPWRTISASTLRLAAGDRLLVQPGDYHDEGQIFVRSVDPETFEYLPLEGSASKKIHIGAATNAIPNIHGYFDIRGSHINISRLNIFGDESTPTPGIGVFESHNITIHKCCTAFHGGGGINFTHSDLVKAIGNLSLYNATANPDQHSGISSYQPIVRTNTNEKYGVVLYNNVCIGNENVVPNFNGDVTDGNGIIIDDHTYTQFNGTLADTIGGVANPTFSSGSPRINSDGEGNLLPYQRRSYVGRNSCLNNGGRGVHVLLSDNVLVINNYCESNLDSQALRDTLPTDEAGNPFFLFGEISVVDSTRVVVKRNTGEADRSDSVAGSELFFDLQGQVSTNSWSGNLLLNKSLDGPIVSVANNDSSDLLLLDTEN